MSVFKNKKVDIFHIFCRFDFSNFKHVFWNIRIVQYQKSILFGIEKITFTCSIDLEFFKNLRFLSFFNMFGGHNFIFIKLFYSSRTLRVLNASLLTSLCLGGKLCLLKTNCQTYFKTSLFEPKKLEAASELSTWSVAGSLVDWLKWFMLRTRLIRNIQSYFETKYRKWSKLNIFHNFSEMFTF